MRFSNEGFSGSVCLVVVLFFLAIFFVSYFIAKIKNYFDICNA